MIDRHIKEDYEKQATPLTSELVLEFQEHEKILNNPSRSEVEEDKVIRELSKHVENNLAYAGYKLLALAEEFRKKGNLDKALYCCELGAKRGNPQAVLGLGMYNLYYLPFAKKEEAEKYYKKAVIILRDLAEKGDITSSYHLGKALTFLGQSEQACLWFEKGAKKDDSDCMFELGKLLFETKAESPEALIWLEKAASQKHVGAITFVHQLIIDEEKKGNHEKSFQYCKLLANLLEPEALNYLGVCHQSGKGTTMNSAEAETCFALAAGQGSVKAMINLAEIYKDSSRDNYLKWLGRAAEKGSNFAKFTLAKETGDLRVLGELARTGQQTAVVAYIEVLSKTKLAPTKLSQLDVDIFIAILMQALNTKDYSSLKALIEVNETRETIATDTFKAILMHLWLRALSDDDLDLLNLMRGKMPIGKSELLLEVVKRRSLNCLNFLLAETGAPKESELLNLASLAAAQGDLTMALTLCPDKAKVAKLLFEVYFPKNKDEDPNLYLLTILRFASIEKVDELVALFECDTKEAKEDFIRQYQKAKDVFLQTAPYFARLSRQADLVDLGRNYNNSEFSNLKAGCKKDMEYGEKRKALALLLYINLTQTTSPYLPKRAEFLERLPPSSKNTRRAAALLEELAAWVSLNQASSNDKEQFSALRTNGMITPAGGRYNWAFPLLKAIYANSQSISKDPNGVPGYNLSCSIKDEIVVLNEIKLQENIISKLYAKAWWYHGRAPLEKTWPRIEDLFEQLLAMDSKNTAELYSSMAELVWLIGNTQPLMRGSGSFAEIMLAVVCLHHDLKPPVLKVDFPQLDVLDISFPLNDYKQFFTYFFEPCTIPESLRKPTLSSLSTAEQIKALYENLAPRETRVLSLSSLSSGTGPEHFFPANNIPLKVEPKATPTTTTTTTSASSSEADAPGSQVPSKKL